ncbi:signal recognition particle-docking protein FtsY [Ferrimonas balearica]|uniref:signal recognition particle-docking protein FtsY n=1 Tax=Ferrimonas balearica TaxID=44012 RepID=UPI001C996ED3|nr:signal recognition particle-docking protein FtsY [Ferrimonas balearica]MBY5922782.1 signal recognition particle-docking protein FtsY [Ferrimonas balearica]MBY5995766.1 signal recognition particle-docking protein FtsY [Ferrimonas balearica]
MAKGLFSWFRREKKEETPERPEVTETAQQADAEGVAAEQAEAARLEAERVAAEQAEVARVEAERVAAEQAEAARVEAERVAAEQAEVARVEAERVAAEQAEAARVEAERVAAEQAEAARVEAERVAAEQAEAARVEAERVAAEQAEAARLEAERVAAEQAEAARVEAERVAAEQAEAARLEAERVAAEQAEAVRLEAERVAAEQAEAERLEAERVAAEQAAQPSEEPEKQGFFARLKAGLRRTSENIGGGFIALFKGKKIDDELFEELETQLLLADVGVETTSRIIDSLTDKASFGELKDSDALFAHLKQELKTTLSKVDQPLVIENPNGPFVILMVGVNGVGKTTTIGKLAKQFQAEGKSVMLAAGDTFRAAAVEQLQVWGERNSIPVIAQHTGADSASVIFDALQAAKARNVDVLIADTAGRLQNKAHLMDELKKIVRVMKKLDENAPHEVMLTLDASTGQNAISQAQIFNEAVGLTGLTLTKLDGTAKGGVIFALADKFGIPVRYIGVGEGIDDLRPFDSQAFIDALFSEQESA